MIAARTTAPFSGDRCTGRITVQGNFLAHTVHNYIADTSSSGVSSDYNLERRAPPKVLLPHTAEFSVHQVFQNRRWILAETLQFPPPRISPEDHRVTLFLFPVSHSWGENDWLQHVWHDSWVVSRFLLLSTDEQTLHESTTRLWQVLFPPPEAFRRRGVCVATSPVKEFWFSSHTSKQAHT